MRHEKRFKSAFMVFKKDIILRNINFYNNYFNVFYESQMHLSWIYLNKNRNKLYVSF